MGAMKELPDPPHKPLSWVGRSLDELKDLPEPVRRSFGYALRFAQAGATPDHTKPLKGFIGAGVIEIVENFDGNSFRAVYTVRLAGVIYVLHCFQKKSKKGIETPKQTIELIQQRLRLAEAMHKKRSARDVQK
jgi:phage-related protein